jgi:hypothetical protein
MKVLVASTPLTGRINPTRQLADSNEVGVEFFYNCETTCLSDVSPRNVAEGQGLAHFRRQQKAAEKLRFVSFSPCLWPLAYNRNRFPETEIAR